MPPFRGGRKKNNRALGLPQNMLQDNTPAKKKERKKQHKGIKLICD